jgi:hypothetical protein
MIHLFQLFRIIRSAAAYYVLKHYPGTTNLSPVHINVLWLSVSEIEKKQCIEEFQRAQESYLAEFEKFLRVNSTKLIFNILYVIKIFISH